MSDIDDLHRTEAEQAAKFAALLDEFLSMVKRSSPGLSAMVIANGCVGCAINTAMRDMGSREATADWLRCAADAVSSSPETLKADAARAVN